MDPLLHLWNDSNSRYMFLVLQKWKKMRLSDIME